MAYYECKKNCKRVIYFAKAEAMQELYDMLNTKIGTKEVYKITIIKFAKRKYVKRYGFI